MQKGQVYSTKKRTGLKPSGKNNFFRNFWIKEVNVSKYGSYWIGRIFQSSNIPRTSQERNSCKNVMILCVSIPIKLLPFATKFTKPLSRDTFIVIRTACSHYIWCFLHPRSPRYQYLQSFLQTCDSLMGCVGSIPGLTTCFLFSDWVKLDGYELAINIKPSGPGF